MKNNKFVISALCCFLGLMSSLNLNGQAWMRKVENLKSTETTSISEFKQSQLAFNEYWKDKPIERGKGYKPFRRWEYFMESRVNSAGNLPLSQWQKAFWDNIEQSSSTSENFQWQYVGPVKTPANIVTDKKAGNGRVNCIAFHPTNANTIYVGAPSGGLWVSTTGGNNWSTTTDQLSSIGVSDIVIDYSNTNKIYIVTGDGDARDTYSVGIIKSTDKGLTWQPTALQFLAADHVYFRRIIMHPTKPGTMYAASTRGIYKTTNGWSSYELVAGGIFNDICFHPTNPSIIYAATYNYFGGAKVYRSTANGEKDSFTVISDDMGIGINANRLKLATTVAEPNALFVLASNADDDGFYGLYKSYNSGNTWNTLYNNTKKNLLGWSSTGNDEGGQGWYDLSLAVSPTSANTIFVGGVNIWKSTNSGTSWSISGYWEHTDDLNYVHADHHMFAFSPLNQALFSGNDGGVYKTTNLGQTWSDLSNGLEILQSYDIGLAAMDSTLIISGNQDNGTYLYKNNKWYEVLGGDGMQCMIDYTNTNIIYGEVYNGDIYKSIDGGLNFDPIKPNLNLTGAWVTPYTMSSENPAILYAGYEQLYKSADGGNNWKVISDFEGELLRTITIAHSNEKYIYVSDYNTIWKTTDGGTSWQVLDLPQSGYTYTDVAVSDINPNHIFISTAEGYIYESVDGGVNWENNSDGLPKIPVNCLTYQNLTNDRIYAGTDLGIYYKDADFPDWQDISGNIPNTIITQIEIQYLTNNLYAGTYGRGIWKLQLDTVLSDHIAHIKADITEPCLNAPVLFTYISNNPADSILWNFGDEQVNDSLLTADTIEVSYSTIGNKSVSITTYKNNLAKETVFQNLINVKTDIDFEILPETIFSCNTDSSLVYVDGNYHYIWPNDSSYRLLDSNSAMAAITPGKIFEVSAYHGTCSINHSVEMKSVSDNMCEALLLPLGTSGPYSNECATVEENEPTPPAGTGTDGGCTGQEGWCQGEDRVDNSVWFKFIMPASGIASISTSGFDNQLAAYSSPNCNGLSNAQYELLAANDDFEDKSDYSGTLTKISEVAVGDTVWVQVDGSFGGATGKFKIVLQDKIYSALPNTLHFETSNFRVFPNPSTGVINIKIGTPLIGTSFIKIYTVDGNLIFEKTHNEMDGAFVEEIDLGNWHAGVFIVQLVTKNNIYTRKVIVN